PPDPEQKTAPGHRPGAVLVVRRELCGDGDLRVALGLDLGSVLLVEPDPARGLRTSLLFVLSGLFRIVESKSVRCTRRPDVDVASVLVEEVAAARPRIFLSAAADPWREVGRYLLRGLDVAFLDGLDEAKDGPDACPDMVRPATRSAHLIVR